MITKNDLKFLGAVKENRDELIFKICPFCGGSKWNFQINLEKNVYHDWVCGARGRVTHLLKENGIELDESGWRNSLVTEKTKQDSERINFTDFKPVDYAANKAFLSSRGIDAEDVFQYNLLFASYGKYKNKLIIPLMENNRVVYFVARDMVVNGGRYLNPLIDKKDLLLYYLGKINPKVLYIVEGSFDGISVNKLGYSVAMLLGSSISQKQIEKIRDIGFSNVVVFLDGDIRSKAFAMYYKIRDFGIPTKIIVVPETEDPNSLFVADSAYLNKLLETPKEVSIYDAVELMLGQNAKVKI